MTSTHSEDKLTRVLFIFAGYPSEMQNDFLPYNPGILHHPTMCMTQLAVVGLERRITHTFTFSNMKPQDLAALAVMNMQRKEGWEIDVEDLEALTSMMGKLIAQATTARQRETNNGNVAGDRCST